MTELKTLKDVDNEWRKEILEISGMTLLPADALTPQLERVKQAAIKHLEFLTMFPDEDKNEYDNCNLKVIEFIKTFFNIGDDLK